MTAIPEIIPYVEYKAREIPYGGPDYTRTEHHAIGVLLGLEERLRCLERHIKSRAEPNHPSAREQAIAAARKWCEMMIYWCDELEK
jgi:hypothetical protein